MNAILHELSLIRASVDRLDRLVRTTIKAPTTGGRYESIQLIQAEVAARHRLPLSAMTSKTRTSSYAHARQVAMWLARELTEASLNEIGATFGGRDHGTVIYAVATVNERREVERDFAAELEELRVAVEKRLRP